MFMVGLEIRFSWNSCHDPVGHCWVRLALNFLIIEIYQKWFENFNTAVNSSPWSRIRKTEMHLWTSLILFACKHLLDIIFYLPSTALYLSLFLLFTGLDLVVLSSTNYHVRSIEGSKWKRCRFVIVLHRLFSRYLADQHGWSWIFRFQLSFQ